MIFVFTLLVFSCPQLTPLCISSSASTIACTWSSFIDHLLIRLLCTLYWNTVCAFIGLLQIFPQLVFHLTTLTHSSCILFNYFFLFFFLKPLLPTVISILAQLTPRLSSSATKKHSSVYDKTYSVSHQNIYSRYSIVLPPMLNLLRLASLVPVIFLLTPLLSIVSGLGDEVCDK